MPYCSYQSLPILLLPLIPGTIQYNTRRHNTIQYNTRQYNTIQYNTIQYNTIQCLFFILHCYDWATMFVPRNCDQRALAHFEDTSLHAAVALGRPKVTPPLLCHDTPMCHETPLCHDTTRHTAMSKVSF